MSTIQELLGVTAPKVYTNSKAVPLKAADPKLLYGMELEIENVPHWDEMLVTGMTSVEDGSLRNNGREFLTNPATFSVVAHILERFFEKNKLGVDNYSERCSIHVHANCQDLTTDQLSALCMLYQVFEKLLYGFVGADRDKNIFCIPWDQTMLTYNAVANIEKKRWDRLRQWQKYTGLNLLPLQSLGTVEFRHMPGTNDLEKIKVWLNLIGSLFAHARNNGLDDIKKQLIELNSTSQYKDLTERVFTDWSYHLMSLPNYQLALEEGVLNMKYSILEPPKSSVGVSLDDAMDPRLQQAFNDLLARDQQRIRARVGQVEVAAAPPRPRQGQANERVEVRVGPRQPAAGNGTAPGLPQADMWLNNWAAVNAVGGAQFVIRQEDN